MEKELTVWETRQAPADVVPGLPAGCPLRCTVSVAVDRRRTVRFVGRIYVGFAAAGGTQPLLLGQCLDTIVSVGRAGHVAAIEQLAGLWARCHGQKLTRLTPADRQAVLTMTQSGRLAACQAPAKVTTWRALTHDRQ